MWPGRQDAIASRRWHGKNDPRFLSAPVHKRFPCWAARNTLQEAKGSQLIKPRILGFFTHFCPSHWDPVLGRFGIGSKGLWRLQETGQGHSNLGFWVCLKIGYLPRLPHVYGENDVPNQQNVGDVPEKKSGIPGIPNPETSKDFLQWVLTHRKREPPWLWQTLWNFATSQRQNVCTDMAVQSCPVVCMGPNWIIAPNYKWQVYPWPPKKQTDRLQLKCYSHCWAIGSVAATPVWDAAQS